MPSPIMNFEGGGDGLSGFTVGGEPPDTNGDVGRNYYFQWLNTMFTIFDKSTGAVAYGPANGNTLWSGFGGRCETDNSGDPIVQYDQLADRWVVSQFAVSASPYYECIAVSQTSDPTGSWYRYAYDYGSNMNDYPKMGVWPDGYYISYNMFASGSSWAGGEVCAFDRTKMIAGDPSATQQCFGPYSSYGGFMPADLDGSTTPPSGAPNYVVAMGTNSLLLWKFHVDWTTPSNSTFTGPTTISVASFSEACSGGTCIPQQGTTAQLDSLADRLMYRLAYRNFGSHESLVVNHSVTGSSAASAVRWYELRDPNGTPTVYQSGTYEPDSTSRWMGSIAMDHMGNIAVGYSASSSSMYPSIWYAGRLASDPIGTLPQAETTIISGSGYHNGNSRWGDYSSMSIDPSDDCTFWYTQEYYVTSGSFAWHTRVASFKYPNCTVCTTSPPSSLSATPNGNNRIDLSWPSVSGATEYRIYRSTVSGGPYTQMGTSTNTTFSDTSVSGGTTYYYVVRAYDSCESENSPEASATATGACTLPPSFAGIQSVTNPQNATCTLDLSWAAASSQCGNGVSYNIYRDVSSGFTPSASNRIASGVTTTSYSDSDSLVSGTTYYYVVRAVDDSSGNEDTNTVEKSGVPTGPGSTTTNYPSTDTPISIPDNDPNGITSTLNVGDTGVISDIMLNVDISHTYIGDLIVELTSPSGTTVRVHNRSGGSANDIVTTYDSLTAPDGPGSMSDFDGESINGNWTLFVSDNANIDTGTLNSWSLDITVDNPCTTGGGCTNPGQPTIDSISDDNDCAQTGVTITYTAGSGAASHDLYVDGALAVTGFTSGSSYDPGDTNSHSYVIRAVDGSCSTDSSAQTFTDADNTPGTPAAPTVTDPDACALTGVEISWNAVTGATAYDLLVDGATTVGGVTSPYTYTPGDSASHTYQVRAWNATCTGVWSGSTSGTDNTATPPAAPAAPTVSDNSACGLTGLTVSWAAVTGATSYDLMRDSGVIATGVTGTSYSDTPGDSASHSYQVRANNSCGQSSGWSTANSGADADHSFTFDGIQTATDRDGCDDTGVVLTWDAPASWNDGGSGTRSFEVWRDGASILTGISGTGTSTTDTTGTNGTSYSYAIRAVNGYSCATDGGASLPASDEVGTPPSFSGLSSVTAMSGSRCGLRLDWSAATPGCGTSIVYNVYRSTTSGFTPSSSNLLASCVPDLFYEDTTVTGGTTYYYVVRAEDNSAGHGGLCSAGYEDTNTVERSGVAGNTTWTENFESGSGGWTASGTGLWHEATSTSCVSPPATSGTHVWYYGQDASCDYNTGATTTGTLTSPTIANVTSSSQFDFQYWREVESYSSGSYDITKVEVSYDSGGTWTQVWYMDSTNASSPGWNAAGPIALSPPSSPSEMLIRFTFDSVDSQYNTYVGWLIDDVTVTNLGGGSCSSTPDPVQSFTARATSGAVKLEWVNPSGGAYGSTKICRDTAGYPDPASCTPIVTQAGSAGAYDSFTDTGLTDGTTYYYTAFVDDGAGVFSSAQNVTARPFATTGQAKWAYSSAASSLAPTGVRPGAIGTGGTWAVSNDRMLHGMNPTTAGGDWPRTGSFSWTPAIMNGPAQARPPVVPTTAVSGASQVVFLGSEDGHAYAVNAETGATLWQSPVLGSILLASPAGIFTDFGGAYDLLFIGSRDATADNVVYMLDPADGTVITSFDNGGGAGGMGIISSSATVDYASNRIYFASRERSGGSADTLWCLGFTGTTLTKVWSKPYGDMDGAPILLNGRLYVGNNSGIVYAIDPANGSEIWHYATTDGAVKGYIWPEYTATTPRKLYFSTTNTVWALTDNGSSASQTWQQGGVAGPSIPLVPVGGSVLYVGSTNGSLYQLDGTTGAVQTSAVLGDGTATIGSPALDGINNMAYVGSESGAVYGVQLPLQ